MSARRTSPILIGREAELRALEEAVLDRAERPVALVGGEAGVGKTRLVRELRARQLAAGATVAVGSCVELGADLLPYAPFVESLGRLVEDLGDRADELLGRERPDLATLLPGLAEVTDAPPGGSRGRMYEAVRAVLDRVPDPLVVVLEDLHWADRSTLELLDYLARRLRHGRTLLLATYRTDELHRRHPLPPLLAELERTGRSTSIHLDPLDREQVARLVHELGVDASPTAALDAIARRSEGNPFLVEELVAAGAGDANQLPGSIRDLLLARVASVDAATRRVLGIVAAVGRPADAELVEMAWDGSEADLDGALRDAIDRGLLIVEPGSRRRLAFRHALLAEAVADDLLPGERVRLHGTLARILAERPDLASATTAGAAAELAHHLLESRDQAAALAAVVRAADAAAIARAYPEARASYERALELWERVPDAATHAGIDHATLLDRAAEASYHAGDTGRAVALGRLAVAESEDGGDPIRVGYLLVRLIEWTEEQGDWRAIPALAERALTLVPEEPPTPERAFALIGRASVFLHQSRNRDHAQAAAEAARAAAACGATGYEAIARSMRATGLVGLGRDEEAIEEAERAAALAAASGGTEETVIVTANRLAVYGFAGHLDRLGSVLAEARQALDREGSLVLTEPYLDFWEACILEWQGRRTEAEALISEHLGRSVAGPATRSELLSFRGVLRVRRGQLDDGRGRCPRRSAARLGGLRGDRRRSLLGPRRGGARAWRPGSRPGLRRRGAGRPRADRRRARGGRASMRPGCRRRPTSPSGRGHGASGTARLLRRPPGAGTWTVCRRRSTAASSRRAASTTSSGRWARGGWRRRAGARASPAPTSGPRPPPCFPRRRDAPGGVLPVPGGGGIARGDRRPGARHRRAAGGAGVGRQGRRRAAAARRGRARAARPAGPCRAGERERGRGAAGAGPRARPVRAQPA